MEELLRSLGIEPTEDAGTIVSKLELKQSEIMERLDNVEDERRRQKLESDLNQIAGAITAFSWMRGKTQTGIAREEDATSEDFSDLKNQPQEAKSDAPKLTPEAKKEGKSEEQLYDEALAVMATPDYAKGVEMMRSLAESGYATAQRQMGRLYSEGNRVQKDESIAVEWYTKAAEQGNAEAQASLGSRYYNGIGVAQNYEKAVEWYQKSAEQGNATAQVILGVAYYTGEGVAQNDEKAVRWYQEAAEQGNAEAQFCLGVAYENGRGVAENYEKAVAWYQKAAEQGNAEAQFHLGVAYQNGEGVAQNDGKAAEWFQKAAEQGNERAQFMLGFLYDEGRGVLKNYEKAAEWYQKAANQGDVAAQFCLGCLYYDGNGVLQDYEKAVELFQKAANQGSADAMFELGEMYKRGQGVAVDINKAEEWYRKAAEQGNEAAKAYLEELQIQRGIQLGNLLALRALDEDTLYRWGMKFLSEGDRKSAEKLFREATFGLKNHAEASYMLGSMYLEINRKVANDWFSRAAKQYQMAVEQGNADEEILCKLAHMYEEGLGVPRNLDKTIEYFQIAADQGSEGAKRRLQELQQKRKNPLNIFRKH